ncbi:MAG: GntR family transcriptional regulator [bacterium]|nr:GntR family transcriptional regulator [bacterium]
MLILDYRDRRPIYEQLVDRLKEGILRGVWKEEEQLPSVRSLAIDLSINPNTIQRAYAELERQGFIYSVRGRGSFVAGLGEIRQSHRQELFKKAKDLVEEAKAAGVTREQWEALLAQAWAEEEMGEQKGGGRA